MCFFPSNRALKPRHRCYSLHKHAKVQAVLAFLHTSKQIHWINGRLKKSRVIGMISKTTQELTHAGNNNNKKELPWRNEHSTARSKVKIFSHHCSRPPPISPWVVMITSAHQLNYSVLCYNAVLTACHLLNIAFPHYLSINCLKRLVLITWPKTIKRST